MNDDTINSESGAGYDPWANQEWEHGDDECDFVESDYEPTWEPGPVGDEI